MNAFDILGTIFPFLLFKLQDERYTIKPYGLVCAPIKVIKQLKKQYGSLLRKKINRLACATIRLY